MSNYQDHINSIIANVECLKKWHYDYLFLNDMKLMRTKYRKLLKEQKYYHIYPTAPPHRKEEMKKIIVNCRGVIKDICEEYHFKYVFFAKGQKQFDELGRAATITKGGEDLNVLLDL